MDLLVSKVPRSLETKTRLFGFELGDLLIVFFYLTLSNFVFGSTRLKFPIVWCGTVALGVALHFLKRGKPENFIQHLGEYFASPDVYSAGAPDLVYRPYSPARKESK